MRQSAKRFFLLLAALLAAVCVSAAAAETLPVGPNGEFSFETIDGWKYYTPDSDLSEVSTTAGYLFSMSDKYVCYVTGGENSAIVCYYATESNAGLQGRDKVLRILQNGYAPAAGLFEEAFEVRPQGNGYLLSQEKVFLGEAMESASAYVFLEHGMIEISSSGKPEEKPLEFVTTLLDSIIPSDGDPFAN